MILHERFRGTSAQAEDNHVLQVAQHTCQYPTARQIDVAGAHTRNDLFRHGVHDIADQCDGGDDGSRLVDEGLVVACDRDTGFQTCLLIDAVVVVSFGEGEEECYEEGHQHEPVGDPDVRRQTTDEHAHHEADGDDRHVDEGVLLQPQTVGHVHQPVGCQDQIEVGQVDTLREWQQYEGANGAEDHHHVAASHGYGSRGDGAQTFLRVQTVCLHITQVVETVDGAGDETECQEDDQRRPKQLPLQQVAAEEDRRKHESVLEPLQGP